MTAHAACSPSSAAMWLACPASITKAVGMTRPSSKYAREGTAAHKVAEMILKGDVFLPDKIKVEDEEFIVSRGMCQALNIYVTLVQALRLLPGFPRIKLEHRIEVPDTEGLVWGTMDCGVHVPDTSLAVIDLKYGKGHLVHPDAPQLKLYALGFAAEVGENETSTKVLLVICQPRTGTEGVRFHKTTMGELWHWSDHVVRPAVLRIADGDETENAGSHCRWCIRSSECAAFAAQHQNKAADVFDD